MGDAQGYAVLVSLYTREEAEVMASALRADGVDAFACPSNHQGMAWLYTLGLGGVRVFVPHEQIEESRALVRERLRENAEVEPEERVSRRDRWRVWALAAMLYGINGYWMTLNSFHMGFDERYHPIEWISGLTFAPVWTGK
jgi:hypothetical protein